MLLFTSARVAAAASTSSIAGTVTTGSPLTGPRSSPAVPRCLRATRRGPEGTGNIPTYVSEGGAPTGSEVYWYASWEDTPGWHEIEGETPVWIDLSGGWSNGVPTSSTNACVDAPVTIYGSGGQFNNPFFSGSSGEVAGSLQITSSGSVTLAPDTDNNATHLQVSGAITNAGTIQLDGSYGVLSATGTITNTGTILIAGGSNYLAEIDGSLNNEGNLTVDSALSLDPGATNTTITNTGTITVSGYDLQILPPTTRSSSISTAARSSTTAHSESTRARSTTTAARLAAAHRS